MNWFERLTGFAEDGYASTQRRLRVEGDELVSTVNGRRYGIGELTMPTLGELRARVKPARGERSSLSVLVGDVVPMHADPANEGALFQVASQFNLLEMVGPSVTPEDGVTRYAHDYTQGPACAMAAGAATIYRNYLVPAGDGIGQAAGRQLDALAGVGAALSELTGMPVDELWQMRNGYALCTGRGLAAIADVLTGADADLIDSIGERLSIGLHRNVDVTGVDADGRRVSQAFCSALPVSYSELPRDDWEPFARLVLRAAYEATLLAAAEQAASGSDARGSNARGSKRVLLTRLGGGAFGNADAWINDAIERALGVVEDAGLDIGIVCHGRVDPAVQALVDRWT